jgi:hypothetical protein
MILSKAVMCCIPRCLGRADNLGSRVRGSDELAAVLGDHEFIREIIQRGGSATQPCMAQGRGTHSDSDNLTHARAGRVGQAEPCPRTGYNITRTLPRGLGKSRVQNPRQLIVTWEQVQQMITTSKYCARGLPRVDAYRYATDDTVRSVSLAFLS